MYKEITTELNRLEKQLFTGHVRFGVEHGDIVSMSVTSKVEPVSNMTEDIFKEIQKFCDDEKQFYGAIEYNFSFGKIIHSNYSVSLHGEMLKERLRKTQGKIVRVYDKVQ